VADEHDFSFARCIAVCINGVVAQQAEKVNENKNRKIIKEATNTGIIQKEIVPLYINKQTKKI
jgi:hypothetical protein